jgi:hypothetical protein
MRDKRDDHGKIGWHRIVENADSRVPCRPYFAWGCFAKGNFRVPPPAMATREEVVAPSSRYLAMPEHRPMPEPALDRPGVVALVGEGIAAGVAQHVGLGNLGKLAAEAAEHFKELCEQRWPGASEFRGRSAETSNQSHQ